MKRSYNRNIFILHLPALFLFAVLFIAWCIPFQASASELDTAQILDLYSQAKELFRKANELSVSAPDQAKDLYRKSALRYERLIREAGIRNGKLFYNLGNVYFRMKDIGRAIVNYRRAEDYIPNDPNLKQNLKYAREKRLDDIDEKQETKVLKTLFFWHYDLSTKLRVIAFSLFFLLLWIFSGIRLFIKRSFLAWSISLTAALSLLFLGSLAVEEYCLLKTRPGVIVSHEVVTRKGNSETYEPSFKEPLHSGTEFTLLEDRVNWYHIELADSRQCWVPSKDVELVR
jgi:tetratricopeptide (TPR) repeat protein